MDVNEKMSMRKYVPMVVAALILGILLTGGPLLAREPAKGSLDLLKNRLANMGFTAQNGRVEYPDVIGMCCQCQLPSCFGSNPASPYGVFVLPPSVPRLS
jgi:hypothetical protein